jgi:hypothetical protein
MLGHGGAIAISGYYSDNLCCFIAFMLAALYNKL